MKYFPAIVSAVLLVALVSVSVYALDEHRRAARLGALLSHAQAASRGFELIAQQCVTELAATGRRR